ncbi:hypothetical protein CPLU01_01321 [Colletotrichum plurivorum]|uniref:Uncharacterized protein n=1 Tax=Colletotrichum plurivorum TaxID=2175906 RepID=A0A8H6NPQ5_9PEZI|nr:hypothetical protein CPLU01_01321 [Colletotrichum plurivorum]
MPSNSESIAGPATATADSNPTETGTEALQPIATPGSSLDGSHQSSSSAAKSSKTDVFLPRALADMRHVKPEDARRREHALWPEDSLEESVVNRIHDQLVAITGDSSRVRTVSATGLSIVFWRADLTQTELVEVRKIKEVRPQSESEPSRWNQLLTREQIVSVNSQPDGTVYVPGPFDDEEYMAESGGSHVKSNEGGR